MTRLSNVVLATRNVGKAREFERLLEGALQVEPLAAEIEMPEETGTTFAENARLKAEAVFTALGGERAVLADDSGLDVRALGGRPGVLSARYAGPAAVDEDNVAKLLADLHDSSDRAARFVCALCLLLPPLESGTCAEEGVVGPLMIEVTGEFTGRIEEAPRGGRGFGYDPVFRPTGWNETLAEAAPESKDAVSHRGAAARALRQALEERRLISHGA